jgi:hypothetical protein
MKQTNDAERLADLLTEQRELSLRLEQTRSPATSESLKRRIQDVRRECLSLVDHYFREALRPKLAGRFPGKGITGDAVVRYTELVNDFFLEVLSRFDDPFWRKATAIELRDHASTAISRDILDVLKRRGRLDAIQEHFLHETESRLNESTPELSTSDLLEVLDLWQNGDAQSNEGQKKILYAKILRLSFVSGMTMDQVAADCGLTAKTAYRYRQEAIDLMAKKLDLKADDA